MLVPTGAEGKYEYDPSIPAGSGGGGDITVESLSVTENDTYTAPAGKAYSPVVVNVPGGSSDYTIAHVTFTNNSSHHFAIAGPTLYEGIMYPTMDSDDMVGDVFDIVLYKGVATLAVVDTEEMFSFTVTGDIVAGRTSLTVSGDGTVVIAD